MSDHKYVAFDVHKSTITVVVLNLEGKIVTQAVIQTDANSVRDFLRGLSGEVHLTFEEGTHAQWLYELTRRLVSHLIVCNECVDICVEIIHGDVEIKEGHNSAILDYLQRASDDLEAARLLAAHAQRRVAVDLSRTSAQSSLMAYEVLRNGHVSYLVFEQLITALLQDDDDLRRVEGLNVTPLLKEFCGGEEIGDSDVSGALETARLIYEFVSTKVAA